MITRGFNASNYIAALEEPDVSQEDLNLSEIASLTGNQRPAHATERHDVETRTQERELEILFGIAASDSALPRTQYPDLGIGDDVRHRDRSDPHSLSLKAEIRPQF